MAVREKMLAPRELRDCNCGCTYVSEVADGIGLLYRCWKCRKFLGELLIGPEP